MYSHSFAVASALVAGAMAQSTSVTSMFLYGYEGQNIVASVISAAPEATSYYVNCAPGTDGSDVSMLPWPLCFLALMLKYVVRIRTWCHFRRQRWVDRCPPRHRG